MKRYISLIFLLIGAAVAYAADQWTTVRDLPYSDRDDSYSTRRCKLDVHYAPGAEGLPVIVWFHGGGLTGGEKFIPSELASQGYVVVAPNYRLIPGVGVEECIDDAAQAVAWTFENASKFGGDSRKIVVAGHSAGGFLTSMIGLDKKWLKRYGVDADSIAALVPYSGQVITHFADRKSKGIGELTPYVDEHAPLFHVRNDCPPYIIITGDAEQELFGRYEENLYMWRMMKLAGHPDVKIFKLDGYNHGDMAVPAHHILRNEITRILKQN